MDWAEAMGTMGDYSFLTLSPPPAPNKVKTLFRLRNLLTTAYWSRVRNGVKSVPAS